MSFCLSACDPDFLSFAVLFKEKKTILNNCDKDLYSILNSFRLVMQMIKNNTFLCRNRNVTWSIFILFFFLEKGFFVFSSSVVNY